MSSDDDDGDDGQARPKTTPVGSQPGEAGKKSKRRARARKHVQTAEERDREEEEFQASQAEISRQLRHNKMGELLYLLIDNSNRRYGSRLSNIENVLEQLVNKDSLTEQHVQELIQGMRYMVRGRQAEDSISDIRCPCHGVVINRTENWQLITYFSREHL